MLIKSKYQEIAIDIKKIQSTSIVSESIKLFPSIPSLNYSWTIIQARGHKVTNIIISKKSYQKLLKKFEKNKINRYLLGNANMQLKMRNNTIWDAEVIIDNNLENSIILVPNIFKSDYDAVMLIGR